MDNAHVVACIETIEIPSFRDFTM